jgi:hypothetical protein
MLGRVAAVAAVALACSLASGPAAAMPSWLHELITGKDSAAAPVAEAPRKRVDAARAVNKPVRQVKRSRHAKTAKAIRRARALRAKAETARKAKPSLTMTSPARVAMPARSITDAIGRDPVPPSSSIAPPSLPPPVSDAGKEMVVVTSPVGNVRIVLRDEVNELDLLADGVRIASADEFNAFYVAARSAATVGRADALVTEPPQPEAQNASWWRRAATAVASWLGFTDRPRQVAP